MKKISVLFILSLILLAGCNADNNAENEIELKPLDVEIRVTENVNADEEVKIDALVSYGEENVEDADEVKFQIWEKGNEEEDEFIEGEHIGDGIYSVSKVFDHDGVFIVVAHVTARSMHNMPKTEIKVGDATEIDEDNHDDIASEEHDHGSDQAHDDHQNSVTVELIDETITSNEAATLSVLIKQDDSALTDATVRFEIWKDGDHHHQYIDAQETESGQYEQEHTFPEHGTYYVNVHVEKDDIHDHIEKKVSVSEKSL